MGINRGAAAAAGAVLAATLAVPAPATPAAGVNVGAGKRADIVKLIRMTGALDLGYRLGKALSNGMIASIKASRPSVSDKAIADIQNAVMDVVTRPAVKQKFLDAAVRIYSQHFSDADIRGMIRFYRTPLGRKVIKALPQVEHESLEAGEAIVRPLRGELIDQVRANLERDHINPRTLQPETPAPPAASPGGG